MPRHLKEHQIDTPTARKRLRPRQEPYWRRVTGRAHLGYRRNPAGDGTWVARFYDGRGYREKTLCFTDDERPANGGDVLDFTQATRRALKWFNERGLVVAGVVEQGPYRVEDCGRDYIAWLSDHRRTEKTARYMFRSHILPAFGDRELSSLTTTELRLWLQELGRTRSKRRIRRMHEPPMTEEELRKRKSTANRIWATFRAALNMAFNEGRVESDLAWRRVKPFRNVDRPRVRFLELEEIRALIVACDADFALLVQGALHTGCRYGELTRLRVDKYRHGAVHLEQTKSGVSRVVFLSDEGEAFFDALVEGKGPLEHAFVRSDGTSWQKSQQLRRMEAASWSAGIRPPATFHMLRHTYASHYLMNGGDLAGLSRQLGHADTRMTMRNYSHLAEGWRREAARKFAPRLAVG